MHTKVKIDSDTTNLGMLLYTPNEDVGSEKTYYMHYDQVGTLKAVSSEEGRIIKTIEYDSFGNVLSDSNETFKVPFGFAGGLYDTDTKLTRFGYRDYDAQTGKWTAKDPIGFNGGDTNLYGYVLQDPVGFVDPEGLLGASIVKPKKLPNSPFTNWIPPGIVTPVQVPGMNFLPGNVYFDGDVKFDSKQDNLKDMFKDYNFKMCWEYNF